MNVSVGKRGVSIGLLVALGALLAAACGSDDGKKKSQDPTKHRSVGGESFGGTGDGGGARNGGDSQAGTATGATGGTPTEAVAGGASLAGVATVGGSEGALGGSPGTIGGAGGTPSDGCPKGFDDCDTDPSTCETPVTSLVQCGSCDVSCSDDHGTVDCISGQCVMTSCASGYGDCDGKDGTTGCELALAEDDAHCGDCLRDCAAAGSTCDTNMCAPVVVDASGSGFLSYFAAGALYVMGSGALPVSNYTLSRIPVDGSARKQVWAASANVGNGALWADDTDVYWAVSGTPPSVLKKAVSAPSDELPTVVFQPVEQPHYLALQGVNFYWASSLTGLIYARSRTAAMGVKGAAIMSVDQGNYTGFVTTPTTIYWNGSLNGPELRMVPITGGTPTPVPDAVVTNNAPLFVNGETLYFVRSVGSNALNGIYSYTAGDATVKQLVAGGGIVAVIADARGIYYKVSGDYHVYKAKLTGSAGVAIATSVYGGVFTGQDDTFIYQAYPWGSAGPAQGIIK